VTGRPVTSNRKVAEVFAGVIHDLIIAMGGQRSTALYCAAVWWKAIEDGEFGD
jgi:hypothetical protein